MTTSPETYTVELSDVILYSRIREAEESGETLRGNAVTDWMVANTQYDEWDTYWDGLCRSDDDDAIESLDDDEWKAKKAYWEAKVQRLQDEGKLVYLVNDHDGYWVCEWAGPAEILVSDCEDLDECEEGGD